MSTIDDQALRALCFLALRVRRDTHGAGPWDEAGLMANLRKIANRNLHLTIEHVLRHAADPNAKSPGVILGSYTPAAPDPKAQPFTPPKRHEACAACGRHHDHCLCPDGPTSLDQQPTPAPPTSEYTAAKAALREGRP